MLSGFFTCSIQSEEAALARPESNATCLFPYLHYSTCPPGAWSSISAGTKEYRVNAILMYAYHHPIRFIIVPVGSLQYCTAHFYRGQ
jgi:hypothetical protein